MSPTNPALRFRFRITAEVDPWIEIGRVNSENLILVPIVGGSVTGDISGDVLPAGGDWARLADDDLVHVEARYLMRTTAGSVVEILNTGVGHRTGDGTELTYFATRPIFRTADPSLDWLHRAVFVGWAEVQPGATTISVYEVVDAARHEETQTDD
ncbi:DUF3237 domain-containing protein [Microbacterium sp. NPDC077184]|uniref:DUF3237 domain-containing protein n=1 Tax=Microbacterium sp. NPDC077184 TaxID=3154764 RepID=UPI00343B502A